MNMKLLYNRVSFVLMLLLAAAVASGQPWVELFNGKTLDGWIQRGGQAIYSVQDGSIIGKTVLNTARKENTESPNILFTPPKSGVTEQEIQKIHEAMPGKPVVQPANQRTMLVFSLCNGFKHGCIPYWAKALDIMSEKTGAFNVVYSTDMNVFTVEFLKQFDAICFNNTTHLVPDEAQQKAILNFIEGGKGIVGIHAATDNFYEWPEGMQMMGGKFTGHPWGGNGTWAVKLDEADHPLMESFKGENFKINDEIYRTDPPLYSRMDRRVLMSLDMSDSATKNAEGVKPEDMDTGISWIKSVGKGRLFYCSLGHNNHLTWNKPVLEHYLAGIQYAMGDYEVDDKPLGETLDTTRLTALLEEVKHYDWDKSRACLVKLENLLKGHYSDPDTLKQIEQKLVETLDSDIPLAAKDFLCRQLSVMGSDASVETLLKMLDDPKTANLGRYALEKIPSPAVDKGLLEKLDTVEDRDTIIGIITTLGIRKNESMVLGMAEKVIDSDLYKNDACAEAMFWAVGYTGTEKAGRFLESLLPNTGGQMKIRLQEALLNCADSLNRSRQMASALKIYRGLYEDSETSLIRAGALKGLVRSECPDSNAFLLAAIRGDDVVVREAAMRILSDIEDKRILEAVASELSALPAPTQVQVLAAMASNPEEVGMKETLGLVQSDNPSVRIAAYQALAQIGDASAVEPLAVAAAQSQERGERQAAQNALYRISGKGVDDLILSKLKQAGQANTADVVVIEYVRAAVQRQSSGAVKVLLPLALSDDRKIASESVKALQVLSGPDEMEQLVDILIAKPNSANETMVVVAGQKESDRNRRADVLLEKYSDVSDDKAKASMLRVMGKLGDSDSIVLLKKEMTSGKPAIQEAAFRAMTDWPGSDFMQEMKSMAESESDVKTKILAFRAYIRMLTDSANNQNRAEIAIHLIDAYKLASRPEEQRIVIASLGEYGTVSALKFVESKMSEPTLIAEAEVALVSISEKLAPQSPSAVKPVLEILKDSQNNSVSTQAQKLLEELR